MKALRLNTLQTGSFFLVASLVALISPQAIGATVSQSAATAQFTGSTLSPAEELIPKNVIGVSFPHVFADHLYFFGRGSVGGVRAPDQQLWKFDGQRLTQVSNFVHDVEIFSYNATSFDGKLYFDRNIKVSSAGFPDAEGTFSGRELFEFDPVTEVTRMVQDLHPTGSGVAGRCADFKPVEYGQKLFLCGNDGATGFQLYELNPLAEASTPPLTRISAFPGAGPTSSPPGDFFVFKDKLYLTAPPNETGVSRLWSYDGTMLSVVDTGTLDMSSVYGAVVLGDNAVFAAKTPATGYELFGYDGINKPVLLADIIPGPNSSGPYDLAVFKGKVYFSAEYLHEDGFIDSEPWVYDGSTASRLADLSPNSGNTSDYGQASWPAEFQVVGDLLFFAAYESPNEFGLWVTDGTSTPTPVIENSTPPNIIRLYTSYGDLLTEFKGRLYVRTQSINTSVSGLWSFLPPTRVDPQANTGLTYEPVFDAPKSQTPPKAPSPSTGTKRLPNSQVRVLATNPTPLIKVQILHNGKEVAWLRPKSNTDPKLRQTPSGESYFVRTVTLKPGKNVIEIFVDGQRVRRVAYGR